MIKKSKLKYFEAWKSTCRSSTVSVSLESAIQVKRNGKETV